jgi:hypothetical protein
MEVTALPIQRRELRGWENLILLPYHLTSFWRHRVDRSLKKVLTQWIRIAFDAPRSWVRNLVLLFLVHLWRWSHFVLRQLELDVYILQGNSAVNGERFVTLYAGDKLRLRYLIKRLFDSEVEIVDHWRIPVWRLKILKQIMQENVDLVILEVSEVLKRIVKGESYWEAPDSVQMVFFLSSQRDETQIIERMKSHKESFRRFRKAGFKMVEGDNVRDFDFFYERMHIPYIKGRHGEYADIGDREVMRRLSRHSRLRFVCLPDGTRVAGSLSMHRGSVYHGLFMGVLDGDWNIVKSGAVAFIYYQEILEAHHLGARLFDGGEVMPFEGDGVFQHKRLWGFEPTENPWHTNHLFFYVPSESVPGQQWLSIYKPIANVSTSYTC